MTNDEKIAIALEQALYEDIAEYEKLPDHKFSRGFNKKMKRLLHDRSTEEDPARRTRIGRKLPIAVIAVVSTFLLAGAAATTYYLWNNFRVQDRGLYSLLNITNVENCPTTLEERYELTADLSGFTENVILDDELTYLVEYENKENCIKFSFMQDTKHGISKMLNTEDKNPPIKVTINGCNGIYYETKYEDHVIIWDSGDYLLEIGARGIGKDELFSLAKFVQKVE